MCSKTGDGRGDRVVGVWQQWRCGRIPTRLCVGRTKKMRASGHKTGVTSRRSRGWSCQCRDVEIQRRDVSIQRRDVSEGGATNATLRSNVAT